MASFICTVCGEIYDEEKEGVKFSDLLDDLCTISSEISEHTGIRHA